MRITRETLLKIARDTVAQRTRGNHAIVGVYLRGSLLGERFLLGGTTDIDLVFIHESQPVQPREIVRLTDAVHLDIEHHSRHDYANLRELRVHPWLGSTLFYCQILHDPQHFIDFIQASVRGQYNTPEHIWQRSYPQWMRARQNWLALQMSPPENAVMRMRAYLDLLQDAADALLSLNGGLLSTRRLLLDLPARMQSLGQSQLTGKIFSLLGASEFRVQNFDVWLPKWMAVFQSASTNLELHPARLHYYWSAIQEILAGPQPLAVLWILLRTWTDAVSGSVVATTVLEGWQEVCSWLKLDESTWETRLDQMDTLLDEVETFLERWAKQNGLTSNF